MSTMIELKDMSKNEINLNDKNNKLDSNVDNQKDEKSSNRTMLSEKIKSKNKQKKPNKKDENEANKVVSLGLSVENINKIISKNHKLLKGKILLMTIYLFIYLTILTSTFIFHFAYLRPTLLTNEYLCFDIHTKIYYQCFNRNKCNCNQKFCVSFCYLRDYSLCSEQFKSEVTYWANTDKLPTTFNLINRIFILYKLSSNEDLSFFQKIGKYFCFSFYYELIFCFSFVLGSAVSHYFLGRICDLYGKRKIIIILTIGYIILCVCYLLLVNYSAMDHILVLVVLWGVYNLLLGIILLPLKSAVYIYTLEYLARTDFLKPINGLLFERYFLSLFLFFLFNNYIKNFKYFYHFSATFSLIFLLIFVFLYRETARFYSERNDLDEKKKSIYLFCEKDVKLVYESGDTEENILALASETSRNDTRRRRGKREINNEMINLRYHANTRISKKSYLILTCYFSIYYCFYTILFYFIFHFCNPNTTVKNSTRIKVLCYMIFIFPILQLPSYFIFEIFSLNNYATFFLLITSLFPFNYDYEEIDLASDRTNYFASYGSRKLKNVHPYYLATCLWTLVFALSIFEMLLLLQVPTLFRTGVVFNHRSSISFSLFLAFMSVVLCEAPLILISVLAFFTACLLVVVRVKWKYDSLEEDIDEEKRER